MRDEIVKAATELLDETGDESAITLRSVARRAGIAAPSIYRHFPDQPNIMLAVVRQIFAELARKLHTAAAEAGDDPRQRLFAVCDCYLDYAQQRPGRYRVMFGGVWMPALSETSVTADEMAALGDESLGLLGTVLGECVTAGCSTSTDLAVDTVALWLGLHGLAHQRAVTVAFPWPQDIAERIITSLAQLK